MNRSNIGNVTTNATQILSVGATTASGIIRRLGHAEDALNNGTMLPSSTEEYLGEEEPIVREGHHIEVPEEEPDLKYEEDESLYTEDLGVPEPKRKRKLKMLDEYASKPAGSFKRVNPNEMYIEDLSGSPQAEELAKNINAKIKYQKMRGK